MCVHACMLVCMCTCLCTCVCVSVSMSVRAYVCECVFSSWQHEILHRLYTRTFLYLEFSNHKVFTCIPHMYIDYSIKPFKVIIRPTKVSLNSQAIDIDSQDDGSDLANDFFFLLSCFCDRARDKNILTVRI